MFIFKRRNRDSAWFSIIDKEWKKIKIKFKKYLKPPHFNTSYKQLRKL